MRVIGKISNGEQAQQLSAFLTRRGIDNRLEAIPQKETEKLDYQLWVADEDRIEEADRFLRRFEENPFDPIFTEAMLDKQVLEERPIEKKKQIPFVTNFFLALCVIVYFFNFLQEIDIQKKGTLEQEFTLTPIQRQLLFDVPVIVDRLDQFIQEHPEILRLKPEDLSPALKSELLDIQQTPYFRGAYEWTLLKSQKKDTSSAEGPVFEKIRHGEIWRLFSPCVLHRDLLHILFNMIWLWVLGRPVEQRIGSWRTLLITLTVGVISNVAQYLMSGPLFLGYSGVVVGLAGFIWMREKLAPWEGYPLQRGTIIFLVFFVGAMIVLQTLSFLAQILTNLPFILSIANTAHLMGGVIGIFLGRFSFFARSHIP